MLMKKSFIVGILVIIVLISGCTKNTDTGTDGPFQGGTEGVSVEFVNLAPPSSFSQNEPTKVKVLLKNQGETRVQTGNAKVKLFGVTLNNFGLPSNYKGTLGPLEPKGEFTAEGGEQEVEIGTINYKLSIINQETYTLRAYLCYPYQTIMKTDVCVLSLLTQESGSSVCDLTGEKIGSGTVSGAPIQVTSLTEQTRGSDQVRFDIKIENKGTGDVFLIDSKCEDLDTDEARFESKDKIKVKIKSPIDVNCGFRSGEPGQEGIVTLDETGVATLSCWKNVEEPVVDKLDVQLDYLYREQAIKQITIYQKR